MGKVVLLQAEADNLALDQAAQAFVDSAQLSSTSLRIYRASLKALCAGLGPSTGLSELQPQALAAWFADRYLKAAPATWKPGASRSALRGSLVEQPGLARR